MTAIFKPLSVPSQYKAITPVKAKKPRRKKGEKPKCDKTTWPFAEMTINQRKVDRDPNAYKYVDYSKYDIAQTLVIKVAGDDDLRPYAFVNAEKRLRRYQNNNPSAHPVQVLFWFSDVQRTRLIHGEFRMEPHDACCVLRDVGLDNRITGVELAFFSEKDPKTLDRELSAMPLEERWIPDLAETVRRQHAKEAEEGAAWARDFFPRFARQMGDLVNELWPSKFITDPAEKLVVVRSFDDEVRKILKRFDAKALVRFDSLIDLYDEGLVDLHWRLYDGLFQGLTRTGYDSDRRLGGWAAGQKSVGSFIELFELHRGQPEAA